MKAQALLRIPELLLSTYEMANAAKREADALGALVDLQTNMLERMYTRMTALEETTRLLLAACPERVAVANALQVQADDVASGGYSPVMSEEFAGVMREMIQAARPRPPVNDAR